MIEAIKIQYGLGNLYLEEYLFSAASKVSFGKMIIAGLAILNGTEEKIYPLTKSHDYFYIGNQFGDDIADWRDDYNNKSYSFLIRSALMLNGIYPEDYIRKWPTSEELGVMIYSSGTAEYMMAQSEEYFDKSCEMIKNMDVQEWLDFIENIRSNYKNKLDFKNSESKR